MSLEEAVDFFEEIFIKFVEKSNILDTFNLDLNSFLVLFFGSLLVGFICLTIQYKIFSKSQDYNNLDYFEKTIISLTIGFLSIVVSSYFVTILTLSFFKTEVFKDTIEQLRYIGPFLYFFIYSRYAKIKKFTGINLLKKFIPHSFNIIIGLNFIVVIILFILVKSWIALILAIVLIVYLYKDKIISKN